MRKEEEQGENDEDIGFYRVTSERERERSKDLVEEEDDEDEIISVFLSIFNVKEMTLVNKSRDQRMDLFQKTSLIILDLIIIHDKEQAFFVFKGNPFNCRLTEP